MALHHTQKLSNTEKRLKLLQTQLYGKKLDIKIDKPQKVSVDIQHPILTSDMTYLKEDLTKIIIFGSVAIGVQLVLYFSHILERIKLF